MTGMHNTKRMSSFKKIGDLICDLFGISLTEEPSQEETKYIPYLK